jgi:hypothetical protein
MALAFVFSAFLLLNVRVLVVLRFLVASQTGGPAG